jgi:hypothetical protein
MKMINWLDDFPDPMRSVFVAPNRDAVCHISFYLSADNKPGWNTVWTIHRYIPNGADEPFDVQTILVPVPTKAFVPITFEVLASPGCLYSVQRDGDSADDTALGDEAIIQTMFML